MNECKDCKWWDLEWDEKESFCHRNAPSIIRAQLFPIEKVDSSECDSAVWPVTRHNDWCGEFNPKSVPSGKK